MQVRLTPSTACSDGASPFRCSCIAMGQMVTSSVLFERGGPVHHANSLRRCLGNLTGNVNTLGVPATVDSVLSAHNVNIEGQSLATRDKLGYRLTDVGTDYAPDVVAALNAMPETVRPRVLS
jgi:hypothetical protein